MSSDFDPKDPELLALPSAKRSMAIGIPGIDELRGPIIEILRDLGGSADLKELEEKISVTFELTEEQRRFPEKNKPQYSLIYHNTYESCEKLQSLGLIEKSGRRRYRHLTERGKAISREELSDLGIRIKASDPSMLVRRFRAETDYPTETHEEQERLRAEWAKKLAPDNVGDLSRRDLLAYTSSAVNYGQYVTLKEGLRQKWIDDLDSAGYSRLLFSIHDLCWGEGELSNRIDRLVDSKGGFNRETGTKGFSGIQVSRTLAICHPEQFLPFPSQIGIWGRESVLRALSLPKPQGSYGQRVVEANKRLREHLAPYFEKDTEKDTVGMTMFLLWLRHRTPSNGPVDLTKLAGELLVDVEFLKDIVSLLEDKGQVILYGPPGTGKTYLARELAKELAPDEW